MFAQVCPDLNEKGNTALKPPPAETKVGGLRAWLSSGWERSNAKKIIIAVI